MQNTSSMRDGEVNGKVKIRHYWDVLKAAPHFCRDRQHPKQAVIGAQSIQSKFDQYSQVMTIHLLCVAE